MSGEYKAQMGAKLGLFGTLVYKDAQGNVLKEVQINGAIPLEKLGLSIEEAQELIQQQEKSNGTDNRNGG